MCLVWSAYYIATSLSVSLTGIILSGIIIRTVAFIVLTIIIVVKGRLSTLFKTRAVIWLLILTGVLGYLLDVTAFIGFAHTPGAIGTILLKIDVIFVSVMSIFILKTKFRWFDWMLIVFMLFGVILVLGIDIKSLKFTNIYEVFFILSALFVSINVFVIKAIQDNKKADVPDIVIGYYNNFVTLILFSATALILGLGNVTLTPTITTELVIAGIAQAFIYVFYYYNIRHYEVWIVKISLLLIPVIANLFYLIFLSKTLTFMQVMGITLVIVGAIAIILLQQTKKPKELKMNV
jgi:drug/metabolite transporter (DMT)-like permease